MDFEREQLSNTPAVIRQASSKSRGALNPAKAQPAN